MQQGIKINRKRSEAKSLEILTPNLKMLQL